MLQAKRIAIFLPSWVGDVVMASPVLRAIRAQCPDARITWVGKPTALATVDPSPWVDESLDDSSARGPRLRGALRMARRLREANPDYALLLPNSFRTAAVAAMARVPRRLGYDRSGRGWLLTDRLEAPKNAEGGWKPVSARDYYASLGEHAGLHVSDRHVELHESPQARREADELFAQAGMDPQRPVVMLNPGASFGPAKMWPAQSFARVADALVEEYGAAVVINAAPSEHEVAAEVGRLMRAPVALNFAGRSNSLGLLKSVLARTTLLVTNDTGARHVGAAMGANVVTIFLCTDPRWAQVGFERERQLVANPSCCPCQEKTCRLTGPDFHRCARSVTPQQVLSACRELLESRPSHEAGR